MSRLFGWDLPPGCSMRDIERAAGGEGPCAVCGHPVEECICPECSVCGQQGDPACYPAHGLTANEAQVAGLKDLEERMRQEAASEAAYYADLEREYGDGREG